MARLIRYTVVNPDNTLTKVKPEISILLTGTAMLDGTDDKGFLMELAPKVVALLTEHNEELSKLTWPDPKTGEPRPFRSIRLGQLDVVLEVVKAYTS